MELLQDILVLTTGMLIGIISSIIIFDLNKKTK